MNLNLISAFCKCLLVTVCSGFFPLPHLNSHFPQTLIPFPSHGWSFSHSHGNPMQPMRSLSFPFPCISLVKSHIHATYYFTHNCCTISLSLSMIYSYSLRPSSKSVLFYRAFRHKQHCPPITLLQISLHCMISLHLPSKTAYNFCLQLHRTCNHYLPIVFLKRMPRQLFYMTMPLLLCLLYPSVSEHFSYGPKIPSLSAVHQSLGHQ